MLLILQVVLLDVLKANLGDTIASIQHILNEKFSPK